MFYSIVIPTSHNLDGLLMKTVQSLIEYTKFADLEVIIVANGHDRDEFESYMSELSADFKAIYYDAPIGFINAVNKGIQEATGRFVVVMHDDVILLPQNQDSWLDLLVKPMLMDSAIGITSPVVGYDMGITGKFCDSFLFMARREMFDWVGMLDPVMRELEMRDLCGKAQAAGMKVAQVPSEPPLTDLIDGRTAPPTFPVYHAGGGTIASSAGHLPYGRLYSRYLSVDRAFGQICDKRYSFSTLATRLRRMSGRLDSVSMVGVSSWMPLWAFVASRVRRLTLYEDHFPEGGNAERSALALQGIVLTVKPSLKEAVEETDLMIISNRKDLNLDVHADNVRRNIVVTGSQLIPFTFDAVNDFIARKPAWQVKERGTAGEGYVILEKNS